MYKVFIVSECRFKALKRTRQIVDSYALRVSSRTWNCNITNEGLQSLSSRLRKNASKNTAIAIYILKDGRNKLYSIIGKRDMFNNDGAYPVSTTKRKHISFNEDTPFNNMPKYKSIMNFIGFVHDVGKIGDGFQKMVVSNKINTDPFRHEFLSLLILNTSNIKELEKLIQNVKDNKFNFNTLNNNKLINLVIMTHHKLPSLDGNKISEQLYLRKDTKYLKSIMKNYNHKEFQNILKEVEKLKDIENINDFSFVHFFYFRLSLMLSDHYISSKKQENNTKAKLLAKSKEYGGESLYSHLYSVGKMSSFIINDLTKLKSKLVSINKGELLDVLEPSRGKFKWQNKSIKSLLSISKTNTGGNFIILSASTGSGKTKTALRIASELSTDKGLRLNVALGLRTLTTQTAKSYKNMLNLNNDMIATLIGSKEALVLNNKIDLENDNDIVSNDELLDIEDGFIDTNLPKYIQTQVQTDKKKKLISTPIVISTIDYLIKASSWDKSSHILSQLRLLSSDLIIDEIDMYNKSDLLHILRLIYITGLCGNNIIITTATIPPSIAKYSYMFYHLGFDSYKKYSSSNQDVKINLLSDYINHSFVENKNIKNNIDDITNYLNLLSSELEKDNTNQKHKIKIVDNIDEDKSKLFKYIKELHFKNNKIDKNGYNYSIGLFRFETIKYGYEILKYINNNLDFFKKIDIKLNIVFYHARLPLAIRTYTEKVLDEALYRKGAIDPYLKSILYKNNIKNNDNNIKNFITIVLASPVEEVGRDHDFDWGIIEPSSARSIIQASGRINRHRDLKIIDDNIYLLNKKLKNGYIKDIYPSIENNSNASEIIAPIENMLPYYENEILEYYFENNSSGLDDNLPLKFISNNIFKDRWRSGSIQDKYVLNIFNNRFDKFDDYNNIVNQNNICEKDNFNDSNCLINYNNIDSIIQNIMDEFDLSEIEFIKQNMTVSKNNNQKTKFSKIFGII